MGGLALVLGTLAILATSVSIAAPRRAVVLELDGIIGPGIADYVLRELAAIKPEDTELVILRMDTPGGLDTSMREIIRAMLAAPVPIVTYVAPGGARAASAGTYITYAGTIAAMAPGTNLGAATPIQIGASPLSPGAQPGPSSQPSPDKDGQAQQGAADSKSTGKPKTEPANVAPNTTEPSPAEPMDTESRKMINDAEAYIRSLADLNGRNAEWAAKAVRASVSLPASEALRLHVIDIIADDVPDLLHQIDGRTVTIGGKPRRLATAELQVVDLAPDWRTQLLTIIANPNIAYILLLIGVYGLFFEFANPGTVAPGVIGGISLLLAVFALNLLPVDYAGAGLVLLGIALMIAEAFIGSVGVIGIGGVIAFAVGSLLMFRSSATGFGLSLSVVVAATVVTAGFFLLIVAMLLRSRRRPIVTGREALIGGEGETVAWQGERGRVRVKGEIWQAYARHPLQPGTRIRVIGREGLILTVEPI
ncbi:nodulation protein NfeD [Dongia soli]|uniref:Nodulation protein NfeD n=1 Tax=Dongia soli TaxID=600628 RepID=A0ABU5EDV6_9PROT|nr:nodulation protein NfeD [Dongia soli]MDY0884534.1 nodulation protein NfeD [Dongia soli]